MVCVIKFCWFTHKGEENHESCSKFHHPPTCHLCCVNCVNIFCQGGWSSSGTPKTSQYTTETLQCNSSAHNSWSWRPQIDLQWCRMISSNLETNMLLLQKKAFNIGLELLNLKVGYFQHRFYNFSFFPDHIWSLLST